MSMVATPGKKKRVVGRKACIFSFSLYRNVYCLRYVYNFKKAKTFNKQNLTF